jgi:hypothetical protein
MLDKTPPGFVDNWQELLQAQIDGAMTRLAEIRAAKAQTTSGRPSLAETIAENENSKDRNRRL